MTTTLTRIKNIIIALIISAGAVTGASAQSPAEIEKEARALRKVAKYEEALSFLREYLEDATLTHKEASNFENLQGHICGDLGRYDDQLNHYLEGLRIREENNDWAGVAGSYLNIGNSFRYQDQDEKSLEYYTKARDLAEETRDSMRWAKALGNMSAALRNVDSTADRVSILLESRRLYVEMGREDRLANNYSSLGIAYSDLGKYQEAIEALRKALSFDYVDHDFKALLHNNIGHDLEKLDSLDAAIVEFMICYQMAYEYDILEKRLLATRNLGDIYARKNMFDSAYKYLELHRWCQLEKAQLLRENETLELQEKYETAEREREIEKKTAQRNMLFIGFGGLFAIALVVVYFLRRNHNNKMALAQQELELKESEISGLFTDLTLKVARSEAEGELKERQRVGRDLHDRIGPLLSSIKIKFSTLKGNGNDDGLNESLSMLDDSIAEIRRVSHNLNAGSLVKLGFVNHIQKLAEHLEASGKIKVNFSHHNLDAIDDRTVENQLSAIIHELAQNTLKHADAQTLTIDINCDASELSLIVEDDGQGFDPQSNGRGIGLKNMKMRVADLNGEFTIDSKPGRGTAIVIDVPLQSQLSGA